MNKRTQKDEIQYDVELRRESAIKDEVISELRADNVKLLENQERLLDSNIQTTELLITMLGYMNKYRQEVLVHTREALRSSSMCSTRCKRHSWDSENGWRRA